MKKPAVPFNIFLEGDGTAFKIENALVPAVSYSLTIPTIASRSPR